MGLWSDLARWTHAAFEPPPEPVLVEGAVCAPDPDDRGFLAAIIGLGAKLARADGAVTADEVDVFSRIFRTPEEDRPAVRRVFDLARQSVLGYESYARQIGRRYRDRRCLLEGVLDGLFHIAKADGAVTGEEIAYLKSVAAAFGFDDADFRRIRASHVASEPDDPYLVLGVPHDAPFEDVRIAYRRLMREHHPDRMASAKSAPRDYESIATEKAAAITSAYARIRAERGNLLRPD